MSNELNNLAFNPRLSNVGSSAAPAASSSTSSSVDGQEDFEDAFGASPEDSYEEKEAARLSNTVPLPVGPPSPIQIDTSTSSLETVYTEAQFFFASYSKAHTAYEKACLDTSSSYSEAYMGRLEKLVASCKASWSHAVDKMKEIEETRLKIVLAKKQPVQVVPTDLASVSSSSSSSSADNRPTPTFPEHIAKQFEQMDPDASNFAARFEKFCEQIELFLPSVDMQDKHALKMLKTYWISSSAKLRPILMGNFPWVEAKEVILNVCSNASLITNLAAAQLNKLTWYPRNESLEAFFEFFCHLIDVLTRPLYSVRVAMGYERASRVVDRQFDVLHAYFLLKALGRLGVAVKDELSRQRMTTKDKSKLDAEVQQVLDSSNKAVVELTKPQRLKLVEHLHDEHAPFKVAEIMTWAKNLVAQNGPQSYYDPNMTPEAEASKYANNRGISVTAAARSQQSMSNTSSSSSGSSKSEKKTQNKNKDECILHPGKGHSNARCFDQHPDLAPATWKKKDPNFNAADYAAFLQMRNKAGSTPAASATSSANTSRSTSPSGGHSSSSGSKTPPTYSTGAQKK